MTVNGMLSFEPARAARARKTSDGRSFNNNVEPEVGLTKVVSLPYCVTSTTVTVDFTRIADVDVADVVAFGEVGRVVGTRAGGGERVAVDLARERLQSIEILHLFDGNDIRQLHNIANAERGLVQAIGESRWRECDHGAAAVWILSSVVEALEIGRGIR